MSDATLFGCSSTTHGDLLLQPGDAIGYPRIGVDVGINQTWSHCVHPNAAIGRLLRETDGERVERSF